MRCKHEKVKIVNEHAGDDTLFSTIDGVVKFKRQGRNRKIVSVFNNG